MVLFTARLMPPKAVGGQERLSADVLQALRTSFHVKDLSNHLGKAFQWPYLCTLLPRIRVRGRQADVADGSDGSLAGPLALGGLPSVLRLNGLDVSLANPVYQRYARRYLPRISRIICNSRATMGRAAALGVRPERMVLIHPTSDAPALVANRRVAGRILFVGRFVPKKGLLQFIRDVWPRIYRQRPDATFSIVGDGPQREQVLAAISQAPGKERIAWLGRLAQASLEQQFQEASVLAMASQPLPGDFEGFGMVSVEAAMRGVPVVAYPTDGVVDAVRHGTTGLIIEGFDPDTAATTYLLALQHTGLQDLMKVQASAVQTWGRERFEQSYCAAVREVAEARR